MGIRARVHRNGLERGQVGFCACVCLFSMKGMAGRESERRPSVMSAQVRGPSLGLGKILEKGTQGSLLLGIF